MKQEQLQQTYQELEQLSQVHIDPATELGPRYLLDKLWECRRNQDRLQMLTATIHRETSGLKKAARSLKAQVAILKRAGPDRAVDLFEAEKSLRAAEDALDDLSALEKVMGVARYNLRVTDQDIRLATRLYEAQTRLGGHIPPPPDEQPVAGVPQVFGQSPAKIYPKLVESDAGRWDPQGVKAESPVEDFYRAMEGL